MAIKKTVSNKTMKVTLAGSASLLAIIAFIQVYLGSYGFTVTDWQGHQIPDVMTCGGNSPQERCLWNITITSSNYSLLFNSKLQIYMNDTDGVSYTLKKMDTLGRLRAFNMTGKTLKNDSRWDLQIEIFKPMNKTVKWGIVSDDVLKATVLDPVAKGYNQDDFFPVLIENQANIDGGYAIFDLKNPLSGTPISTSGMDIGWKLYQGSNITSMKKFYLVNISHSDKVTDFKNVCNPYLIKDPANPTNTTVVDNCTRTVSGWHWRNYTSEDWIPITAKIITPQGDMKIKIVATWPVHLGPQLIDWYPSMNVNGTQFIKSAWQWWDASYTKRYQIIENKTTEETVAVNGTNKIGGDTLWALTKNDSYIYATTSWYGQPLSVANETAVKYFEWDSNISSSTYAGKPLVWPNARSVWHFTGTTGTQALDSALNTNLTISGAGGGFNTTGLFGSAYYNNGAGCAQTNASMTLSGTNKMTIVYWIMKFDNTPGDKQFIEYGVNTNSVANGFYLEFGCDGSSLCQLAGRFRGATTGDGGPATGVGTAQLVNSWYFVAFRVDRSQPDNQETVAFLNDTKYTAVDIERDGNNGDLVLYIGGRACTSINSKFLIDEFRVYTTALTDQEILNIYYSGKNNITRMGGEESGAVAYALNFTNQGQSSNTPLASAGNTLYAQLQSSVNLDWAFLSTNETGAWKNYTTGGIMFWNGTPTTIEPTGWTDEGSLSTTTWMGGINGWSHIAIDQNGGFPKASYNNTAERGWWFTDNAWSRTSNSTKIFCSAGNVSFYLNKTGGDTDTLNIFFGLTQIDSFTIAGGGAGGTIVLKNYTIYQQNLTNADGCLNFTMQHIGGGAGGNQILVYEVESNTANTTTRWHTSPMNMTKDTTAQWSNFTWFNSTLSAGSIVGWKIYFNDTSNHENVTGVYNFTVGTTCILTSSAGSSYTYGTATTLNCSCPGNTSVVNLYYNNVLHNAYNGTAITLDATAGADAVCNLTGGSTTTTLIIAKATLAGTVTGTDKTYPNAVSETPAETNGGDADVEYRFYRDNTLVSSQTGSAPSADTTVMGVGGYTWKLNTTGTTFVNYSTSASIATDASTVNKGTLTTPTINKNVTTPITYPTPSTVNGTGCLITGGYGTDIVCTLYRGNSSWSGTGNDTALLGAGVYAYNYTSPGGANWSAATATNYTLVVNKAALTLTLNGNVTTPITYPTPSSFNGTGCLFPGGIGTDVTCTLYRGNSSWSGTGNDSVLLGVGVYAYNYSTPGGVNYSVASASNYTLTVNKGTLTLTLNRNATSPITYPTASSFNGTGCVYGIGYGTDVTCTLYRGNSSWSGTGNDSVILGVGSYAYNYSTPGGANWSSATATNYTLTVNKGTLAGTSTSPTVTYSTALTATGTETNMGDADVEYREYCELGTKAVLMGSATGGNPSGAVVLDVGAWGCKMNTTGTVFANWSTSASIGTSTGTVNKGTFAGSISSPDVTYPTDISVSCSETNIGDSDVTYQSCCNSNCVNGLSGTFDFAAGVYTCKLQAPGTWANWTTSSSIASDSVTVNKGTPAGSSSSPTVTYPNSLTATGTETNIGDTDVVYNEYCILGTKQILMGQATDGNPTGSKQLDGGAWACKLNTTGATFTNWTASASIGTSTGTVNTGALSLFIASNVTSPITYPTPSSVNGTGCNFLPGYGTDVVCTLYRGNSSFSTTGNDSVLLGAGVYAYNYSTPGGTNWTRGTATNYTLVVNIGPSIITIYLNGTASNRSYELLEPANITVYSLGHIVCLSVTHGDLGDNFTCGTDLVSYIWKNVNNSLNSLNDSTTIKNITYTSGGNQTVYLNLHANDTVKSAKLNLTGFLNAGVYPSEVRIYIDGVLSNYIQGNLVESAQSENRMNDSTTTKNLTFTSSGSQTFYINLLKNANISNAYLNLSAFQGSSIYTSQLVYTSNGLCYGNGTFYGEAFAQSFKTTTSFVLGNISINIRKAQPDALTSNVTLELRRGGSGVETSSYVTSANVSGSTITDSFYDFYGNLKWYNFTFSGPTLNASDIYWVIFKSTQDVAGYNSYWMFAGVNDNFGDVNLTYTTGSTYWTDPTQVTWVRAYPAGMNGAMTFKIFQNSNVTSPYLDVGGTGAQQWNFSGSFNQSNNQTGNLSSAFTSFQSGCVPNSNGVCNIPVVLHSQSGGVLQVSGINITYTVSFNPVTLNQTLINSNLTKSSGRYNVPITISSDTKGIIQISGINVNYNGSALMNVTAATPATANYSATSTAWWMNTSYSKFNITLPYSWTPYLMWFPITNNSKNVTPYGQSNSVPIFNNTGKAYEKNFTIGIKLNETVAGCLNLTWSNTSSKVNGTTVNTSLASSTAYQTIYTNLGKTASTGVWLWIDMYNCNATATRYLQPNITLKSCCTGCLSCW